LLWVPLSQLQLEQVEPLEQVAAVMAQSVSIQFLAL
jgi:hypothetical protein